MTTKEEKHITKFIDHLTKVTVRISTWNENGELKGRSSGFLYQSSADKIPIIITVVHKLPEIGPFIETRIIKEGKTFSINAGKFNIFYNHNDIDYAHSELPIEIYKEELEDYKDVEFITYQHKFIKAIKDEAYIIGGCEKTGLLRTFRLDNINIEGI